MTIFNYKNINFGWLTPTGELIENHLMMNFTKSHNSLAFCIIFELFKDKYNWTEVFEVISIIKDPVPYLENIGYIRLHCHTKVIWILYLNKNMPNDSQLEIMNKWAKDNNTILKNHIQYY